MLLMIIYTGMHNCINRIKVLIWIDIRFVARYFLAVSLLSPWIFPPSFLTLTLLSKCGPNNFCLRRCVLKYVKNNFSFFFLCWTKLLFEVSMTEEIFSDLIHNLEKNYKYFFVVFLAGSCLKKHVNFYNC